MNFDPFYNLLNGIVAEVNNFSTTTQNGVQTYLSKKSVEAQKAVTDFSDKNIKDIDFNLNIKTDINLNTNIL
jgi:Holliday junction resolvase RusA-like endonuclease